MYCWITLGLKFAGFVFLGCVSGQSFFVFVSFVAVYADVGPSY